MASPCDSGGLAGSIGHTMAVLLIGSTMGLSCQMGLRSISQLRRLVLPINSTAMVWPANAAKQQGKRSYFDSCLCQTACVVRCCYLPPPVTRLSNKKAINRHYSKTNRDIIQKFMDLSWMCEAQEP